MRSKNKSIKQLKKFDNEVIRAIHFLVNTCLNKKGNQIYQELLKQISYLKR